MTLPGLPGVAQVAMQQGAYVARTIAQRLEGEPQREPFRYRDRGSMAAIGRGHAMEMARHGAKVVVNDLGGSERGEGTGKAADDTRVVLISKKSGIKNFDEMLGSKAPIKFAAAGIGSAAYIETRILQNALKLNAQIVPGFDGNEGEMSMLRNEVAAEVGTATSLENFVKNGNGYFALAISDTDTLPGVPKAMSYAKDEGARKLIGLVSVLSEIGRLTAGPVFSPWPGSSATGLGR